MITSTRPIWITDLELAIFDTITNQHAPHLLKRGLHETKPPETKAEIENFYRFRVAGAAHDFFIVQVCAHIIGQMPDPELQLFLS
jgi:hypothetical protein